MARPVNWIVRLGSDPVDVTGDDDDMTRARMRAAMDIGWGDNRQTQWITLWCVGRNADFALEYLAKGRSIFVIGELQKPKIYNEEVDEAINVSRIEFAGSRGDESGETTGRSPEALF